MWDIRSQGIIFRDFFPVALFATAAKSENFQTIGPGGVFLSGNDAFWPHGAGELVMAVVGVGWLKPSQECK